MLDYRFQLEKAVLKKDFLLSFKTICKRILELQATTTIEVAYLSCNMLRTRLLNKECLFDIHVYDSDWYLNDYIKVGELDVKYFFDGVYNLWDRFLDKKGEYVGGVSSSDIENIISSVFESIMQYVVLLLRYSIQDALNIEEFQCIKKTDKFIFYVSELYDKPNCIYRTTKENCDYEIFLENIEENKPSRNLNLMNLNLDGNNIADKILEHCIFSNSSFANANFSGSYLEGLIFDRSNMENIKMSKNYISGVSFVGANLRCADFSLSLISSGFVARRSWTCPSNLPTVFSGADLRACPKTPKRSIIEQKR